MIQGKGDRHRTSHTTQLLQELNPSGYRPGDWFTWEQWVEWEEQVIAQALSEEHSERVRADREKEMEQEIEREKERLRNEEIEK